MNGWRLLSSDRQEVGTSLRAEEDLVHADLKYLLEVYQELYWQAPSSYLGDRVRERVPDPASLPGALALAEVAGHRQGTCSPCSPAPLGLVSL